MALIDPPLYVQSLQYSARQDRFLADRIFTEGVSDVGGGELAVTQRVTGGANMSVDVAPGVAVIAGDSVANQGKYVARVLATDVRNVPIPAPPASNSRIDLVVLQVHDSTADGGDASLDGAALEVVSGVAASVPVAPAVPASALVLAQVVVAAGVSSIVAANITDRRVQLNATTLKVGTEFITMTTAERDALTGADLWSWRTIVNSTTGQIESYVSGAWVPALGDEVKVATSFAYPAVTAAMAAKTYTVPLGVAFRTARVAFPLTSNAGGVIDVGRVAGMETGIGRANGTAWASNTGFMVCGQYNGLTYELLRKCYLSGTDLVIETQRFYDSGSGSIPSGTQSVTVIGRN